LKKGAHPIEVAEGRPVEWMESSRGRMVVPDKTGDGGMKQILQNSKSGRDIYFRWIFLTSN
jgi:hypothetical protein